MDWKDSPEQRAFRNDVRTFIRERFPKDYTPDTRGLQSLEPEDVRGYNWAADRCSPDPKRREGAMRWAAALAERGWVAPHWPKEYGGAGLTVAQTHILSEEMARAGVPQVNGIGVNLLGPTLIVSGSEEQKREHLPNILSGEVAWAQGFSEPGAGSDLAGLKTTAVRDGDEYVINGQKIWTTHAQFADWLFILARTDPEAPKHRGISFFLLDAKTPGVTVAPIEDMRGDEPFNEVFFDDVRVPWKQMVGEENRGWYVAMSTLDFERSGIGATVKYRRALEELVDWMGGNACEDGARPGTRQDAAQRAIEVELLNAMAMRTVSMQEAGELPNVEASQNQLFSAELHQRLAATGMEATGPYGMLLEHDVTPMDGLFSHKYLEATPYTILSGTAEIQRNVIATRGLGLPRE